MTNLLINKTNTNQSFNKKIYDIKAEKLIREAVDNFIYFKDYEIAMAQAQEVLELDPINTSALILKGNIYFCKEETDIAFKCLEEALEIDSSCAEAYILMANIFELKGNLKEALEFCNKAYSNLRIHNKDLLLSFYDKKIALLIKLKKYEEAKQTLKESYKYLGEEGSLYMASCYRDVIDTLYKEKTRKKNMAVKRLKLVHSS